MTIKPIVKCEVTIISNTDPLVMPWNLTTPIVTKLPSTFQLFSLLHSFFPLLFLPPFIYFVQETWTIKFVGNEGDWGSAGWITKCSTWLWNTTLNVHINSKNKISIQCLLFVTTIHPSSDSSLFDAKLLLLLLLVSMSVVLALLGELLGKLGLQFSGGVGKRTSKKFALLCFCSTYKN